MKIQLLMKNYAHLQSRYNVGITLKLPLEIIKVITLVFFYSTI